MSVSIKRNNRNNRNNRNTSATLAQHDKKSEFLNCFASLMAQRNNRNTVMCVCLFNYLAIFKDKIIIIRPGIAKSKGVISQLAKSYRMTKAMNSLEVAKREINRTRAETSVHSGFPGDSES
jgi:hypothetical protein